ncbi:MAG: polysaccharide export protein [Bacteroidales bacterium]|nr:polysaccharide export protein [Bacteroidales bacterium]
MRKQKILISAALVLMVSACSTPANVVYFQDSTDKEIRNDVVVESVRLRPADKVSIIVNCADVVLMQQFNLPYVSRYVGSTSEGQASYNTGVSGYIVDADGNIDFPVVGKVHLAGLTRAEAAEKIKNELQSQNLIRDPVVTVDYLNLYVSLMGEVARPGRYPITRDAITILDALSLAGDLTIFGRRDNIRVIREEGGVQKTYLLDLCSMEELVKSPAYYICQNDLIYVEPNAMRTRQSTVNGNTVMSTSFWISIASLAASLVSTITLVALRAKSL